MKANRIFLLLTLLLTATAGATANPTDDAIAQAKADSIARRDSLAAVFALKKIESVREIRSTIVVDTLPTSNEALSIVLYNDNTWRYVRNRHIAQDTTVYSKYWNTDAISAYREVALSSLPRSVAIPLVDSLKSYHYPYIGKVTSRYGPRRNRNHNGIDMSLSVGDTIYAAFDGRIRFSKNGENGGYGNLVIVRHDNGLESYMGHLSARLVEAGDWVVAGQPIALGGNSGRSTGPHLHFEFRYCGQSFDPERLIDFKTGALRRETFMLKRSYFDIYSQYNQNFDDEIANILDDKREAAEAEARRYHVVRRGDTLSGIAYKYRTSVKRICALNNISASKPIIPGKKLRIR